MLNQKTTILTFTGSYLPGYKGGGQLHTIANMVEHLSDDFEFWIVTRDRDLGDDLPYSDVTCKELPEEFSIRSLQGIEKPFMVNQRGLFSVKLPCFNA